MHVSLEGAISVTSKEDRNASMVMYIRITHRRSVQNDRAVKQGALAFLDLLQLFQEVGNETDVILVDHRELRNALWIVAVVRGAVESSADTAFGICASDAVA